MYSGFEDGSVGLAMGVQQDSQTNNQNKHIEQISARQLDQQNLHAAQYDSDIRQRMYSSKNQGSDF